MIGFEHIVHLASGDVMWFFLSWVSSVSEGAWFSPVKILFCREQGPNLGLLLQQRHQDDAEHIFIFIKEKLFYERKKALRTIFKSQG